MKKVFFLVFSFFLISINVSAMEFYVSTVGNDSNTGTIYSPFKTLDQAKQVVSAYNINMAENIYVYLKAGTYELSNTFTLGQADSGSNGYRIIYSAYNNEKVIISGGITVPSYLWEVDCDKYKANLGTIYNNTSGIRQLYINDTSAIRARKDVTGWTFGRMGGGYKFYYTLPAGYPADYLSIKFNDNIEMVEERKWTTNRLKITGVGLNMIDVFPYCGINIGVIKWLENAKEFIDESYEWYYDKGAKCIYLKLPVGENPNGKEIVIPVLEKLIEGTNVSNVSFEGIQFSYATWLQPNNIGYNPKQSSVYYHYDSANGSVDNWDDLIPGNIVFKGSQNVILKDNVFTNLGADGLVLENGCKNFQVERNSFFNISSNAIRLGNEFHAFYDPPYQWPDTNEITEGINIVDNIIHDVAKEYFASNGIFLTFVRDIEIKGNEIYNLPWSGISVGFAENSVPTVLGNINIQYNKIHNVVNMLSDGGAIYNHGAHYIGTYEGFEYKPSIISYNIIYDIPNHSIGVRAGIYLDNASSNFIVNNNYGQIFSQYETVSANIFLHEVGPNINLIDNSFNGNWSNDLNLVSVIKIIS